MHAQYRTLRSLRSKLRARGIDETKFISVFGLRTHGVLPSLGPATEQIYVHSKAMIVDDEAAIVGSANINDRSLLGMRDSEVNIVIQDEGLARAGGLRGGAAANLRKALFVQHLGLSRQKLEEVYDNLRNEAWVAELKRVAKRNTEIYEELFGALPSDQLKSWQHLAARRRQAPSTLKNADFTRIPSPEAAKALQEVQGYLVEFPIDFLAQEDLAPSVVANLLGPVFT
ncbi:unnamed protein product [Effrenium voratum]|uniref:phospholipase D n=1 Tax=Effrenium voratum TaxID=2562239 RepID=A0AA36IU72_9DINO|nr:unnamed protein product [Effrenium voratum]